MSTSNNRQLSYTALKEIVPLLPFTVRLSLAARSRWITSSAFSVVPPIKFVRLHLPYGLEPRNNPGVFPPQHSGVLTVDTTTWNFEYDDLSQQVRVTCSLYPGRERISSQKTLAKELFSFFIDCGVEQLELEETADPFEHIQSLNCRRLKWKLNGSAKFDWFQNIRNHIFEELQIVNAKKCVFVVDSRAVKSAKHLIWTDKRRVIEQNYILQDLIFKKTSGKLVHFRMWPCKFPGRPRFAEDIDTGDEPLRGIIEFKQCEKVLHVRMGDPDIGSVVELVKEMRKCAWQNGSIIECLYEYGHKCRVWTRLTAKFPNLKRVMFPDREISVLRVTDDYVMYVECFVEKMVRFKVSKVARAMCQLDLNAFL